MPVPIDPINDRLSSVEKPPHGDPPEDPRNKIEEPPASPDDDIPLPNPDESEQTKERQERG